MNKLLQIIALAIAAVAGFKKAVPSLQKQLEEKDREIADLKSKLEAEDADDAALQERADAAELQRNEIQAQLDAANAAGDQLAAALEEEPVVPTVHPETFEVTAPPTGTLSDLAFRDRQAETEGRAVGSGTQNPAPPAANQGKEGEQTSDQQNR